jgi:toxin HigB-1
MIRDFQDEETRKIFNQQRSLKLDQGMQAVAERKLRMLHNSRTINDLHAPPADRQEKLEGNRKGLNQHQLAVATI